MTIEIDQKPNLGDLKVDTSTTGLTTPGNDREFIDLVRKGLADIDSDQHANSFTTYTTPAITPQNLQSNLEVLRHIKLENYFKDSKGYCPHVPTQDMQMFLEYSIHYTEHRLLNQPSSFSANRELDRILKLENRMYVLRSKIALNSTRFAYPQNALANLENSLDALINEAGAQDGGSGIAQSVIGRAPEIVSKLFDTNVFTNFSRLTSEMNITHQILDPLKYFYGGRGEIAAPQLNAHHPSRFDRSNAQLASRSGSRNSRNKEWRYFAEIDCSHYAYFQRQAIARAAGMSDEWIKKHIKYKTSSELAKDGCMSVKKAVRDNLLREGDVLAYPGHCGVVARNKEGKLCIFESTTSSRNSITGKYESGVQISDLNAWIARRSGQSNFNVYRDRLPIAV